MRPALPRLPMRRQSRTRSRCNHGVRMISRSSGARVPTVSVVIPTRDRWAAAHRAVQCALQQRDVDVDVIVVDDGSSDVPSGWFSSDPRMSLIRRPKSGGMAAARNAGLELASGRWIAFLDDDDLWAPTKLMQQVNQATQEGAGFAYADALVVSPEGRGEEFLAGPAADQLPELLRRYNAIPAGASNV